MFALRGGAFFLLQTLELSKHSSSTMLSSLCGFTWQMNVGSLRKLKNCVSSTAVQKAVKMFSAVHIIIIYNT